MINRIYKSRRIVWYLSLLMLASCSNQNDSVFEDVFGVSASGSYSNVSMDSYSIISDNNGNGVANPGETVYLKISIKNSGTATIKSMNATFSSSSTYASNISPSDGVAFGDIPANKVVCGSSGYIQSSGDYYTLSFKLASSIPDGTQIPIEMVMTDAKGNHWSSYLSISVKSAFPYVTYTGDQNLGNAMPGYTWYWGIYLSNTGTSMAKSVKATFTTTSPYVTLSPATPVSFGNISAGDANYGGTLYYSGEYYTFSTVISSSTPSGTKVPISIKITDENGNSWTSSAYFYVYNQ